MSARTKTTVAAGGAAVLLAVTAVVGGATGASASGIGKGYVPVCAQGNYGVTAEFPHRGGISTTCIPRGTCSCGYWGGTSREPIEVTGWFNTSDNSFKAGAVWYKGNSSGIGIGAEGTTSNGGAGAYMVTWQRPAGQGPSRCPSGRRGPRDP
ncbi:hypothetical protein ACH5AO_23715 [Streptomyces sp. NPDC018964]|uniref:hypothetical protein n=1 Tax=Streptomyces sp. NPDC018964 TaxID=3365058 RepID=UPI0037A4968A